MALERQLKSRFLLTSRLPTRLSGLAPIGFYSYFIENSGTATPARTGDPQIHKKPIYLSAAAQAVLASLPRIDGNPHIIAGAKEGAPRADLKKPWAAVKRAAGLEEVRLHDLRHSFASFGAGASLGLPIIGKLLGHSQAATTHRYAHLDADPLRRAVDAIGATISAAMDGGKRAPVIALKKRRST